MKITVSSELIEKKASLNEKIYLKDLPEFENNNLKPLYNTVFNKSVTGIGGTSLALDSSENIIILMPFVEVVKNKENYNADVFTVKEGVTQTEIVKYLKSTNIRKIVSTYDGLIKIIKSYNKVGIDYRNDFLLVDEWQVIFQQFGLRNEVMRFLLDNSTQFKNKCFMTATPIKKDYWFRELNGLCDLTLEYNIPSIPLKHFKCQNVIIEASAIINNRIKSERNLHFFLNSVDGISSIIKECDLNKEDVRIVCANNKKNKDKLSGFSIQSTKDLVKKINFYTSTAFEGCDIYDKDAEIFVLCNGNRAHTLLDISTTLFQVAGRIRDIKDNTVNLIYTTTRYIDITEEEFNKKIDYNIKVGRIITSEAKSLETIEALDEDILNSNYIVRKNGKLIFEEVLLNVDKSNFEITKTYNCKANIIAKSSNLFIPITISKPWQEEVDTIQESKIKRMSFKDKCIMYNELIQTTFSIMPNFDKEVIDAVNIIGIEQLQELEFNKKNVIRMLLSRTSLSDDMKILKALTIIKGNFYKSGDLKEMFRGIYNDLDLNKTPKGSDIEKYFEVKKTTKWVNGKSESGYVIICQKVIFN